MSLPYQPTCDPPGLHRMTRDSDVSSKPSNNLGRQARYPTHADCGGTSRNQTRGPGGPGRKRDTTYSAGPGGHLPLAPGFSRSGEYVGPGPSRTVSPLLQRPPHVTRHPHAWTATRIRACSPRNLKSGPAPRGALHSRRISSHFDHPGREAMEETTQSDYFAHEDSDRARPPTTSGPGRLPKPDPRDHIVTRSHGCPLKASRQLSTQHHHLLLHHGTRAPSRLDQTQTCTLIKNFKSAGRRNVPYVTRN
jgi:hypothetical protein